MNKSHWRRVSESALTPYIAERTMVRPSHMPGMAVKRHHREPPVRKFASRIGALRTTCERNALERRPSAAVDRRGDKTQVWNGRATIKGSSLA